MTGASTRIIGGMFGLALNRPTAAATPAWAAEPRLSTSSGRSAFAALLAFLKPTRAWLPSYLCPSVLPAFARACEQIAFYPVDETLRVQDDAWLDRVRGGEVVVFIDYFGVATWHEQAVEARARGAWIVEDACQALLNDRFDDQSHYVVLSPRKFVGVPDGGILLAQGGAELPPPLLPAASPGWWMDAFAACALRGEFDRHGGDRAWFELFQKAEAGTANEPSRMSELSACLLNGHIDYAATREARCRNYAALEDELEDLALFPRLAPGVAPLGFPVRLANRDEVRERLFAEQIYAPTHWPLAGSVPSQFEASHRLASQILTLPCDQRYGEDDMRRIAACMRAAGASSAASMHRSGVP